MRNNGTVYRSAGKYLRASEYVSHTGNHYSVAWVEELHLATVFYGPPSFRLRAAANLTTEMQVSVIEERIVHLVQPE